MAPEKVLIIEENERRRQFLTRFLNGLTPHIISSSSLTEAVNRHLKKDSFSLVVLNLSPLNSSNIKLLEQIKKTTPRPATIVLSADPDHKLAITLINKELIDHLAHPENTAEIYAAIRSEFHKKELRKENESYLQSLRKLSSERSKDIKHALELEDIYNTTLENLMTALDLRDVETLGHSRTVARYSLVLAEILGIKDRKILDNIRKGALLHDIGKIAIPDSILKKPSRLSREEWEKIKLHPSLGFGLIKEIKLLKEAGNIILYHHERFDGNGYPDGLKREKIPLEARIFALADALDAITSHRPYRKERDFFAAKKEIEENNRSQFDPDVTDAFCSLSLEKWERIRFETTKLIPSLEEFRKVNTTKIVGVQKIEDSGAQEIKDSSAQKTGDKDKNKQG